MNRRRISQQVVPQHGNKEGRREDEEGRAEIIIDWWPQPPQPPFHIKCCRCPSCNYEMIKEEGARCLNSVCPNCGYRLGMIEVTK